MGCGDSSVPSCLALWDGCSALSRRNEASELRKELDHPALATLSDASLRPATARVKRAPDNRTSRPRGLRLQHEDAINLILRAGPHRATSCTTSGRIDV